MRTIDDVAVTAEIILALRIDGLPTSDRALRHHAKTNHWPVVYDKAGKSLFLVDAIPEPFGQAIRNALHLPFQLPPPLHGSHLAAAQSAPHSRDSVMEARLVIVFEVFRRAAYIGEINAIKSLVQDARVEQLPQHLWDAGHVAVGDPVGRVQEWADDYGILPYRTRLRVRTKRGPDPEAIERRWKEAEQNGTLRLVRDEYMLFSYSTVKRWVVAFNRHGASGLRP